MEGLQQALDLAQCFSADEGRDATFVAMLGAFRRTGGLVREAEVLARFRARELPTFVHDGVVVKPIRFEWGQQFWLPWFQLDLPEAAMRPGPSAIIAVLAPAFDDWEMAAWFALPNPSIGFSKPVDIVDRSLDRVLGVARADRIQRCDSTARS